MADLNTTMVTDVIQNSDHDCVLVFPTKIEEYQDKLRDSISYSISYRRNQTLFRKCLLIMAVLIVSELRQKGWNILYKLPTCKLKYHYFNDYMQELMDTYIPVKKEVHNHNDKPWITKDFRVLLRQDRKLGMREEAMRTHHIEIK